MNAFSFLFLTISLVFFSCKSSRNNSEVKNIEKKTETISDSVASIQSENLKHRFKVSFISMGAGIDYKTKEVYDQFISKFEKDNSVKVVYEILRLGKEGETSYCFNLVGLGEKLEEIFIIESTGILKSSKLIHVDENAVCR